MHKKDVVSCKVTPYALYDVLRALTVCANNDSIYSYYEMGVTKEDDDLVVWVTKEHLPKPTDTMECSSKHE